MTSTTRTNCPCRRNGEQRTGPTIPQWTISGDSSHLIPQFPEAIVRQLNAAYYGVCTYLDRQIGRVLNTLDQLGLTDTTRIIYTTDHGEHLGGRGIYGKFTMYEESAAVPFLMAGPDVPAGKVVETPVSLVDSFPTILEAVGAQQTEEDADLPGESLWTIAQEENRDRTVFSEYQRDRRTARDVHVAESTIQIHISRQ